MADVIIIRIYPKKPTTAAAFANDLVDLRIEASEMSALDPRGTAPSHVIGAAFYDPVNPASRIVQSALPPLFTMAAAVATAVIDVSAFETPGYREYQSSDIRLRITRGTQTIVDTSLNYNVAVQSGVTPLNGNNPGAVLQYMGFGQVALYLPLPSAGVGLGAGQAYVDIPTDGSPPNYDALLAAVKIVLDADPGPGAYDLRTLTVAQCKHVANEIFWNRTLEPLPAVAPGALEQFYTAPGSTGFDTERGQFEADLTTYYTTGNTQADVLAKYVYALSAALACEQLTVDAAHAGFEVPILPGIAGPDGKVAETAVILSG